MAEGVLKYGECFSVGMVVEVELPLAEGKLFRDNASIVSARRDLLELQLSNPISPESVILEMGSDLFLRSGEKGEGYRCRAIFLYCDDLNRLHVRLAGEIIPFNEREFFRVDVFIPLSYSRYSAHGRREMGVGDADGQSDGGESEEQRARMDDDPERPLPVVASLSGAGVRIDIPERFEIDELLELTLHLPYGDTREVTLLGQVVHVVELGHPGDHQPLFGTALRFLAMDDLHRETLMHFIYRVQVEQLKRLREESMRQAAPAAQYGTGPIFSRRRLLRFFLLLLFAFLFAGLVHSLVNYRHHRSKGEIERTFEDQIRRYMEGR